MEPNIEKTTKRATETIKTRRYRFTKRNPQSQKAIFKIDRGNVEQVIQLSFPHQTELKSIDIPKEKNPNLHVIKFSNLKIACYINTPSYQMQKEKVEQVNQLLKEIGIQRKVTELTSKRDYKFEKGFIYDSDGNYSGNFSIADLKNLYSDLGAFLKVLKVKNP